jgi:hypothetical protein
MICFFHATSCTGHLLWHNSAAVALPATLLKVTDVIDNPWQIASDRSIKAGIGKVYDQTDGIIIRKTVRSIKRPFHCSIGRRSGTKSTWQASLHTGKCRLICLCKQRGGH